MVRVTRAVAKFIDADNFDEEAILFYGAIARESGLSIEECVAQIAVAELRCATLRLACGSVHYRDKRTGCAVFVSDDVVPDAVFDD